MEIGEFGVGRPDFGGRRPRGEALGQKKKVRFLSTVEHPWVRDGVLESLWDNWNHTTWPWNKASPYPRNPNHFDTGEGGRAVVRHL